jgi:hypothetical protein
MIVLLLVGGGIVFAPLSGCDPTVQDAVLTGLNDFAVSMIDAVFLMWQSEDTGSTTPVTVEAITQILQPLLA